jgi:hypothetical protein
MSECVRGTCVAVDHFGVLLRGRSGSGKSDLAFRLIADGAELVSDDYTELRLEGGRIIASAPEGIRGLLEVRSIGIVRFKPQIDVPLAALVDLLPPAEVERHPDPACAVILGISLPVFGIDPFEASAAAKVRLAVRIASGSIMRVL